MSEQIENGGPAFPRPAFASGTLESKPQEGMTLRDYFAGQAMLALLQSNPHYKFTDLAFDSYSAADEMLNYRDQ